MTLPVKETGRRSASAFTRSLGLQLDALERQAAGLAADLADEGRFDGVSAAHTLGEIPRRSPFAGRDGDERGDAPATRGGAPSENAQSWLKFAMSPREEGGLGLSRAQASGIVGNLQHESGPDIKPSGVSGDHGSAHGAAQWRNDRFARLREKAAEWGLDWRTTEAQQRFMRHELDGSEARAYGALRAANTPEDAADAFNRLYERSADPGSGRRASARRIFEGHDESVRGSGRAADAVEDALRLEGLHERRDRATIRQYLRTGGVGMDPATTAWCAAFVNSSLQQHGVRGSGSQVANSFQRWGVPARGEVQRGDVIVDPHHRGPNVPGGHVGLATGATRTDARGRLYLEMISGNKSDRVLRSWEPADARIVRRAASAPETQPAAEAARYEGEAP